MTDPRRFQLDELTIRPGTYFNPQTEVLLVVDDSPEVDHEIFDLEEFEDGLRCIAAPVRDQSARVVAALGIAGPRARLEDGRIQELIPVVVEAADLLSRNLGYVQDHGFARVV